MRKLATLVVFLGLATSATADEKKPVRKDFESFSAFHQATMNWWKDHPAEVPYTRPAEPKPVLPRVPVPPRVYVLQPITCMPGRYQLIYAGASLPRNLAALR